jgi:hypothetical protein
MKRKYYWWIFGVIQVAGIMGTVEAMFLQFPTLLIMSMVILLPGSLFFLSLFAPGHLGSDWSPWRYCATAVVINVFLFIVASLLVARRRRIN